MRKVKESAIAKLKMTESSALDWARYLVEQGNQSISNDGPVGPWSLPSHDEEELVTVVDHTTMKTGIIGGLVNRIVGVFAPVSPEDIIPVNTEDSGDR